MAFPLSQQACDPGRHAHDQIKRGCFLTTFASGTILPLNTAIYIGVGTSIMLSSRVVTPREMVEYAFNDEGLRPNKQKARNAILPKSLSSTSRENSSGTAELFRDQIRRILRR